MPSASQLSTSYLVTGSKETILEMVCASPSFFIDRIFGIKSFDKNMHVSSVCLKIKSTDYTPIESKKPIVVYLKYMFAMWVASHSHLFLDQIPINLNCAPSSLYVTFGSSSLCIPLARYCTIVSTSLNDFH